MRRSSKPIFVGPWTSEVGFETLYWLPWLAHVQHTLGIDPSRLIPITRGGASQWYGVPKGLELFLMRTPQELRVETKLRARATGMQKQGPVRPFDTAIYADAANTLGIDRYLTLHPGWMYETLAPFWEAERGLAWLQRQMRFAPMVPGPVPEGVTLPSPFVAVRFYARPTFPATPQTIEFVKAVLQKLAKDQAVIILDSGVHADEHVDIIQKELPKGVVTLSSLYPHLSPANNLAVQSAVLAQSVGFVGTYGGIAQMALRLRKPSVSYYVDWHGTCLAHQHLSEALALQSGVSFIVTRLHDLLLQQSVSPTLQLVGHPS